MRDVIDDRFLSRILADAIATLKTPEVIDGARELLTSDKPLLQRAAMRILRQCPSRDLLDRLWQLHVVGTRNPAAFLREYEGKHQLYEESVGALRECCRLDPAWLERKIECADSENEPVQALAYLVGSLGGDDGRDIWQRCKRTLFAKIRPDKQRSLATCIGRYSDAAQVDWLLEQCPHCEDLVGPAAMQSLARIAPEIAVKHLDTLPTQELVLTRSWYADHLFGACGPEMRAKLLEMMRQRDDPREIAELYRGREHHLDAAALEFLLDDLEVQLETVLSVPDWGSAEPLYRAISLLGRVGTLELLERFREKRGTPLELRLCDFLLRIGPQRGQYRDSLVRARLETYSGLCFAGIS